MVLHFIEHYDFLSLVYILLISKDEQFHFCSILVTVLMYYGSNSRHTTVKEVVNAPWMMPEPDRWALFQSFTR